MMSSGVQGISANVASIPCNRNHVLHKASKSIDGICAKLQLSADERKFVDINDIISKQTNHVDDGVKLLSKIKSISPDTCVKDIERSVMSVKVEEPCSVEYSVITTGNHYVSSGILRMEANENQDGVMTGNNINSDPIVLRDEIIFRGNPPVSEETTKLKMAHEKVEEEKNKAKGRHTTQYNNWHHKDMLKAINAVQLKELSMTAAAKKYNIPRTTLRHYLNDGTNKEARLACFSLPKECEDELLSFVIENRHNSEKILYKMIFEKAKVLSRYLFNGDEKKRHAPTPAWIRRFVYRHKSLYDLFPTCLTRFEHPLNGRKKAVTDPDDAPPGAYVSPSDDAPPGAYVSPYHSLEYGDTNMSRKNDNCAFKTYDIEENHFPSHCTEIIYPTSATVVNSSEYMRGSTSDEYSYGSEISHDEFDARLRQRDLVKAYDNFTSCSMVAEERKNNQNYDVRKQLSTFENGYYERANPDVVTPFKKLITYIPKPQESEVKAHTVSKQYNMIDEDERKPDRNLLHDHFYETVKRTINQNNAENQQHRLINLSTVPLISSKPVECNIKTFSHHSELPNIRSRSIDTSCLDLEYQKSRLFSNDFDNSDSVVKISEINVAEGLLDAMEKSIGSDYVQLFTERYHKNKKLERIYCKWLTLKVNLEMLKEKL